VSSAPPAQAASSFSDPFAAHTPKHIAPKSAPEPEPAEVVEVAAHAASASAASAPAAAADPFAGMSPEDAETHRKAQRFARLLVDEIKLYNQAKVAEGRRHKDLYDRLKEDIDKSRSTYTKRYGTSAAASGDYFQKEVVRNLAEEDMSIPIHFHDLERSEESKSDLLIMPRGDHSVVTTGTRPKLIERLACVPLPSPDAQARPGREPIWPGVRNQTDAA